jgi:UDP-glucose 4-epimerase
LVFSSTAATYGEPESVPITEDAPTKPTSAYGATKLAIDHAITSYAIAHGLAATSLRYFNIAGAYAGLGERHPVESHLIPLVLQVATGKRSEILVFGNDWPTPDGTCIRDYIHVRDLADAHLLALQNSKPGEHQIYNLGNGTGFSVREVIASCERVTGASIAARDVERRAGDPAVLIASSEKAITELGWKPQHATIDEIVAAAWEFTRSRA